MQQHIQQVLMITIVSNTLLTSSLWQKFLSGLSEDAWRWHLKLLNTKTVHKSCKPSDLHHIWKWIRAVPEIIRGGTFVFRPLHPQDKHGVRAPPQPRGHASALINPPHYGSNMPGPPGQVTPPPLGHIVNKTPSTPQDKKVPAGPPPLRIISGTSS